MISRGAGTIGLVMRSGPYHQRSARGQLDVALAASALEQPLRLYFLGAAVLQLLGTREPGAAHLPAGYRAWASLSELTVVTAFAEPGWLEWLAQCGNRPVLPLEAASRQQMQADWRACHKVLVL